jgi:GT2 family glycosyltransferase
MHVQTNRVPLRSDDAGPVPAELTVVVLNWGSPDLTIRCVRSLLADGVPPGRLVIMDNGSEDDSHAQFQAAFPDCVIQRIEHNVGFAKAANAGARMLDGDAYLFVDNDAFVHRAGSVEALLRCLADDSVGIVMARILNEDLTLQRTVHPIQTPAVAFVLWTGLSRLLLGRHQPRWGRRWDHQESCRIAAASGVAMLVRGVLWDELGGYPEDELVYAEDLDLCWRAGKAGWSVWYTTAAEFVHRKSATIGRDLDRAQAAEQIGRAEASMTRRNLSTLSARTVLGIKVVGLGVRSLLLALVGRRNEAEVAWAELRGTLHPNRTA